MGYMEFTEVYFFLILGHGEYECFNSGKIKRATSLSRELSLSVDLYYIVHDCIKGAWVFQNLLDY